MSIDGVIIKPLKRLVDERGYLQEILRCDDEAFLKFGQVYLSVCNPGIVKAWHAHRSQTDYFCVVSGNAKVGLWDGRPESPTYKQVQSLVTGELNPTLICIPPLVWHGFAALGATPAMLLNVVTEPYHYAEPDELRRDPFDPEIGLDWTPRSG